MKIHEYQAKDLLREWGINAQEGIVATTKQEAQKAARELHDAPFVVKAQVHCGGRGKAGGVKLAKTAEEAGEIAEKILGMKIVSDQTGIEGKIVNKVLIVKAADIRKEYYLSITIDNQNACPVIIASSAGGTEIEVIAHDKPELVIQQPFSLATGLKDYHARIVAEKIGLDACHLKAFTDTLKKMAQVFIAKDCSLIEINPLVITAQNELLAIDAKINFDDNALFRHPDIVALRDMAEEDAKEAEAAKSDLSYVSLDGNIGCMVNGAGLAMATMDIIKAFGGEPANFLDVGGSATAAKVAAAFKILLGDGNLRAVLVNIFGGIMKCDIIAEGIVSAAKETNISVPLIVRLNGTNVDKGKEILSKSGLKIHSADNLEDAAKLAVSLSKKGA